MLFEEMKVANKHMTSDAIKVDADAPWNSPNATVLDNMNTAQWLRGVPVSRLCKLVVASQLAANNGAALGRKNYLGNPCAGKRWWTGQIFGPMARPIIVAEEIRYWPVHLLTPSAFLFRLQTPVTSIRAKSDRVIVQCATGETLEADEVVLAVPPSVWHRIQIEPDFPRELDPGDGNCSEVPIGR